MRIRRGARIASSVAALGEQNRPASARARFADEPGFPTSTSEQMDRTRTLDEVLGRAGDAR